MWPSDDIEFTLTSGMTCVWWRRRSQFSDFLPSFEANELVRLQILTSCHLESNYEVWYAIEVLVTVGGDGGWKKSRSQTFKTVCHDASPRHLAAFKSLRGWQNRNGHNDWSLPRPHPNIFKFEGNSPTDIVHRRLQLPTINSLSLRRGFPNRKSLTISYWGVTLKKNRIDIFGNDFLQNATKWGT